MSSTFTLVATWVLANTAKSPAESSFLIGPKADDEAVETSLSDDLRKVVDPTDIAPGGKYRSIVKLQIRYENQAPDDTRFAQGTGWLIKPDILVTAGHCAYDHTYQFGKASEVKAYLGYNGKASLTSPDVQFRSGKRIATTKEWVASDVNRAYDVSFIQLDKPFNDIVPILYQSTPPTGKLTIGVVGYPADMTFNDEHGAQMYEMYKEVNFDLRSSRLNMLEYTISSYAGQSGSPVLIQGQNESIGVHVYGLGTKNSASVIRGTYGNRFGPYIHSFSIPLSTGLNANGIKYLKDIMSTEHALEDSSTTREDFWGIFKTVADMTAKVGSTVLSGGSPFLGPIAGPIAAAAGTALGIAGKLINKAENSLEPAPNYKAHASQAILFEAALQTVLKMDPDQLRKYKISQNMIKTYQANKADVGIIAKKLAPALMDSAVRISIAHANRPIGEVTSDPTSYPRVSASRAPESTMDSKGDAFVKGLQQAAQNDGHEETFIDFLGSIAKIGMQVIPAAVTAISSSLGKGESSLEPKRNRDSIEEHVKTLCHRSMMGNAALQALLTIPPKDMHTEDFFNDFIGVVKNIGSTVIRVAPSVVKAVAPIVIGAVTRGESNFEGANNPKSQSLRPKVSLADLLKNMGPNGPEGLDDSTVVVKPTTTTGPTMNGASAIAAH